ncbi:MAG TPA: immune inhibitor A domain-containing protein, partial [Thermoplasmata archaeon]|nr:immune inhibitor A domain-containing protein [Thermoplasmata archaeon]
MRKLGAALVLVVLLAPALIAVLEDAPAPQAAPRAEARLTPKVVRGPQLTHPDPLVWPTPPFVSIPDADLLRPRTRDAIGTARIVVILAEFTDVTHLASKTMSFFDNQINGQSGATMRAYYAEASYNQLTIQATVVNWVNTGHTMAYYGTDSASGTDDGNGPVYRLVVDAVLAANAAGVN